MSGRAGNARQQGEAVRGAGRGGFTVVELVVVVGIGMVVLGLMMPVFAEMYSQARLTRDMALLRQHAAVIDMYASDYRSVYPIALDRHVMYSRVRWYEILLESGHLSDISEVDPHNTSRGREISFQMSMAMVYSPALMRPGHTVHVNDWAASPIRQDQVLFPSSKGLVFKAHNGIRDARLGALYFCCANLWKFPVSMADGSIATGTYIDFNGGKPLYRENAIGAPVATTWFGVRGRDRYR